MKTKLLFFVSLFSLSAFSQSTITWSNEITVDNGSVYGNVRPRIAVTSGNIPVIMWGGGTATQPLLVARWNGSSFGTPVQVTPMGYDPFIDTWAGADIAAYGNTVYVVFKVQPEMSNNIYIVKSTDGGVTWTLPTQVDIGQGPYDRFPSVAVTAAGNPVVMYMTFDTAWATAGYAVSNSNDGGATFSTPVNVSNLGGSIVCDCCPGYVTVNGNTQAATWRRNNNNRRDMWAGISTNGGMTFTTGIDVDNTDWMLSACPSTGPDPFLWNDSLYTVFMSGASGDDRVYLSTFNITTSQQGFIQTIAPNYPSSVIQNYPFSAGKNDTVGVVWQQDASSNIDSYFTWSTTGASGLINNESVINTTTANDQRNPHIAYSSNTFHICWTDLSSGNVMYRYGTITPTGIAENISHRSLQVFPDPSSDVATIDLSCLDHHDGVLKIFDVNGKEMESSVISGQEKMTVNKFDAGIYFAEVTDETTLEKFCCRIIFTE
ncbi:MAG: T9SS type A sorting domain-containing protein [Bacteroidetes bacterium]|nr:T9SS type A sorting domain-containing protein [Bacteroidota bacterium]